MKFFQVQEESAGSSRVSRVANRLTGEEDLDHWFLNPGEAQEERTKEEIVSRRISLRYSSVIGSREDDQILASGVSAQKIRSGPSDLEQVTHQSLDRTGAARGLPSGLQPSKYRESRGQENRDTSSFEMPGRSGSFVCGDTWRRSRHQELGYRHSQGQEIG
jgi:hypothetical protein